MPTPHRAARYLTRVGVARGSAEWQGKIIQPRLRNRAASAKISRPHARSYTNTPLVRRSGGQDDTQTVKHRLEALYRAYRFHIASPTEFHRP
jgi:hypothetical protein